MQPTHFCPKSVHTLPAYTYDKLGNITNASNLGSYSYAETSYANPDAATSIAGVSYSYDANGNLYSAGSNIYGWDYRNRMATFGNGSITAHYSYDVSNNRVSQSVVSPDGSIATTTYLGKYYQVSTDSNTNSWATPTDNIWAGGTLIASVETIPSGTASSTYTRYIYPDHLGSTNVITDPSGNIYKTLDYYPYGAARISSGASDLTRTFLSQQHDDATNLSYLNARYYNPSQGQFLSQDPIFLGDPSQQNLQDPQSLNAYSYSENNPITKSDPSGKYWDFSGSITIPDPFQPELPGPSFSLDLQVDRSGDYSLSASPGFGWGAYAKPFSAYHVPGPVPNDPVTSTAGSDFFIAGASANNNNGVYTNNPLSFGFGAGADVYVRWPFTLASNLPPTGQPSTFVPNTTISAYNSSQYSQNTNNSSSAGAGRYIIPTGSLSSTQSSSVVGFAETFNSSNLTVSQRQSVQGVINAFSSK